MSDVDERATEIVKSFIDDEFLAKDEGYGIFIVWKSKVLQNAKYLISTNRNDDMYYEVTYNGDDDEWYLDAYKKVVNKTIRVHERG